NLATLEREREMLETRIAQSRATLPEDEHGEIERRLQEIHARRVAVLSEVSKVDTSTPLSAFIAYAREDERYRVELGKHLRALERQGIISTWHDRRILAGQDWKQMLDDNLDSARIVLLLLSSDFIDSDYA